MNRAQIEFVRGAIRGAGLKLKHRLRDCPLRGNSMEEKMLITPPPEVVKARAQLKKLESEVEALRKCLEPWNEYLDRCYYKAIDDINDICCKAEMELVLGEGASGLEAMLEQLNEWKPAELPEPPTISIP